MGGTFWTISQDQILTSYLDGVGGGLTYLGFGRKTGTFGTFGTQLEKKKASGKKYFFPRGVWTPNPSFSSHDLAFQVVPSRLTFLG